MEYYIPRIISKDKYEIASFKDSKEPYGVYTVLKRNYFSCDCIGFYRQKDKTQHKHCNIVEFWINYLNCEPGFCFWYENEDLEFKQFFNGVE